MLIGCGKAKSAAPCAARDLYTGSLFAKRRAYAEASPHHWWIVSAKLGLVCPDQVVQPYDLTMSGLSPLDRSAWALSVARELLDVTPDGADLRSACVEIHAGADYAENLRDVLRAVGLSVDWPVEGMEIGEQMRWYSEAIKGAPMGHAPSRPERAA